MEDIHLLESYPACETWNGAEATALAAHSPEECAANLTPPLLGAERTPSNPSPSLEPAVAHRCHGRLPPLRPDPALLLLGWIITASSVASLQLNYRPCRMREEGIDQGWLLR